MPPQRETDWAPAPTGSSNIPAAVASSLASSPSPASTTTIPSQDSVKSFGNIVPPDDGTSQTLNIAVPLVVLSVLALFCVGAWFLWRTRRAAAAARRAAGVDSVEGWVGGKLQAGGEVGEGRVGAGPWVRGGECGDLQMPPPRYEFAGRDRVVGGEAPPPNPFLGAPMEACRP